LNRSRSRSLTAARAIAKPMMKEGCHTRRGTVREAGTPWTCCKSKTKNKIKKCWATARSTCTHTRDLWREENAQYKKEEIDFNNNNRNKRINNNNEYKLIKGIVRWSTSIDNNKGTGRWSMSIALGNQKYEPVLKNSANGSETTQVENFRFHMHTGITGDIRGGQKGAK